MINSIKIIQVFASLLFYADYNTTFDAVYSKGNGHATIEIDRYEPSITTGNGGKFGEAAEARGLYIFLYFVFSLANQLRLLILIYIIATVSNNIIKIVNLIRLGIRSKSDCR